MDTMLYDTEWQVIHVYVGLFSVFYRYELVYERIESLLVHATFTWVQ